MSMEVNMEVDGKGQNVEGRILRTYLLSQVNHAQSVDTNFINVACQDQKLLKVGLGLWEFNMGAGVKVRNIEDDVLDFDKHFY